MRKYYVAVGFVSLLSSAAGGWLISQNRYAMAAAIAFMAAGAIWVSVANAFPFKPRS